MSNWHNEVHKPWLDELLKKKIENGDICGGCYEWPEFCCCEEHSHVTMEGSNEVNKDGV